MLLVFDLEEAGSDHSEKKDRQQDKGCTGAQGPAAGTLIRARMVTWQQRRRISSRPCFLKLG